MVGPDTQKHTVRFLALGDSYTIGEGVAESMRWPNILGRKMVDGGIGVDAIDIIAQTGWTVAELDQGITKQNPVAGYSLVSIMIGVNNQYRAMTRNIDDSNFVTEFESLLDRGIALAGGNTPRVFVVSIPDYGLTPVGRQLGIDQIQSDISRYNNLIKEAATAKNVRFINITDLSLKAENDPQLTAEDGLHPSGKMYQSWVDEALLPEILEILDQ